MPTHNFPPKIVLLKKNDKHRKYRIIVFGKTNSTFLGPWFRGFYQMHQTGLKMTNNALHILNYVCFMFIVLMTSFHKLKDKHLSTVIN